MGFIIDDLHLKRHLTTRWLAINEYTGVVIGRTSDRRTSMAIGRRWNTDQGLDAGDNTKGPKPTAARRAAEVRFAVDVEAHVVPTVPTAEPTKQDQRAPIKMVSGRAWSPGIYQALRLLGISPDVAWERVFIHPLTFN